MSKAIVAIALVAWVAAGASLLVFATLSYNAEAQRLAERARLTAIVQQGEVRGEDRTAIDAAIAFFAITLRKPSPDRERVVLAAYEQALWHWLRFNLAATEDVAALELAKLEAIRRQVGGSVP